MFNNKGQSLVLFILILPILLGIMVLVIDMGNVFYKKNEINNTLEFVLNYGLEMVQNDSEKKDDEIDETESIKLETELSEEVVSEENFMEVELDKLKTLLQYNLEQYQNEIRLEDEKIVISSKTYVKGIFSNILGFQGFLIDSEYYGYLDGDKKVIQKIK